MIQLTIIIAYLLLLLAIGGVAGRWFRGTSRDYLLASHSIGPFLLLMSLFGTTMTAFALVGSSGEAYSEGIGVYGLLASSSGIVHSLCFFLIGVKIWSLGRKYGYTTQIQFFRDRLESDRIGLLLFPILVGLVVPYLLIGVLSSGTVVTSITEGAFTTLFPEYDYGVPPWLASLVISIVVLIYVFFGGMRGTAWANTFQTLVFMALGVVTFAVISNKLGGPKAATLAVQERHPSKLMRSVDPREQEQYVRDFAAWEQLAGYNYAVDKKGFTLTAEQRTEAHAAIPPGPPWAAPFLQRRAEAVYAAAHNLLPDLTAEEMLIAQLLQDDRIVPDPLPKEFAAKKLEDFPKAPLEPIALAYFQDQIGHPRDKSKMTRKQAVGRYRAMRWAPVKPHGMDPWAFFSYMLIPLSMGMFPHLFQHWLTAKNASSFKLAIVAHPICIAIVWLPCILVGVWATAATMPGNPQAPLIPPHFNPNGVLAYMVGQLSNEVLAGFLTAGVLAAIMSSLDSQFLCVGTMFTEDVVLHYGGKNRFSDKQVVLMARTFIVAIVAVTYGLSLFEMRRVFTLGVWTFSGFTSLFPLVCAAIYWPRLTKAGAYACVIVAAASWLYFFQESRFGANPTYTFAGLNPVAAMIALSTAAMVVVSLVTRPPSRATLARFFPERVANESVVHARP